MSPRLFVDVMAAFRFSPPPLVRPKWMLPLLLCRNCTASGFCTSQVKLCLLFGPMHAILPVHVVGSNPRV